MTFVGPMRTPSRPITVQIFTFCKKLDPSTRPIFVPVRVEEKCERRDCIANVQRKVAAAGGEALQGWNLTIWPKVVLHAQFHSVYVGPDGVRVDITPNEYNQSEILFLPDSKRTFRGERIKSERLALTDDKDIDQLIELDEDKDRLEESHLARRVIDGVESLSAEATPEYKAARQAILLKYRPLLIVLGNRYTGRNDLCWCGSGKKFKRCGNGRLTLPHH